MIYTTIGIVGGILAGLLVALIVVILMNIKSKQEKRLQNFADEFDKVIAYYKEKCEIYEKILEKLKVKRDDE